MLVSVVEDIPLIEDEKIPIPINHHQFKTLTAGKTLHGQVIKAFLRIKLPEGIYILSFSVIVSSKNKYKFL